MSVDTRSQVAVEFDLYSDTLQAIWTMRFCNRGPLFSRAVPSENYEPRLITPINLGTAISVQTYGQPMRALDNQGTIEFHLGNEIFDWTNIVEGSLGSHDLRFTETLLSEQLHWIGREFRVYEGEPSQNNFREDLDLVFSGRITDVTHDTRRMVVRTGDVSIDLDAPLVSTFYPDTALSSIATRPRPQAWGTVICIEPVLIDDINLIFDVSWTGFQEILSVRVGGIEWAESLILPPGPGEWYADPLQGTIQFGSELLGGDVRCDVEAESVSGLGGLIASIVGIFGLPVDFDAMQGIDDLHRFDVGYFARDPVNGLSALDDIVTGCGCWWGVTPTGMITAGFIGSPSAQPDVVTVLNKSNVLSMSLSQSLPPAWRVPVEYERHWQTEGQFFEGIDEPDKQRWSSSGLKIIREDETLKIAEPRAYDVPTMRSVAVNGQDASVINNIFWDTWSAGRKVNEAQVWIDAREIKLYDTIAVDYMMFRKNYRILSATIAVGGGPAQLQLWG